MATYRVIGQPIPRVDGVAKTTGQAHYAADVSLPGTLWGKSLHSPYAHVRIVRIDTTAAQRVPGVHAVITGADVRAGLWGRAVKDVSVCKKCVACSAWPHPGTTVGTFPPSIT